MGWVVFSAITIIIKHTHCCSMPRHGAALTSKTCALICISQSWQFQAIIARCNHFDKGDVCVLVCWCWCIGMCVYVCGTCVNNRHARQRVCIQSVIPSPAVARFNRIIERCRLAARAEGIIDIETNRTPATHRQHNTHTPKKNNTAYMQMCRVWLALMTRTGLRVEHLNGGER